MERVYRFSQLHFEKLVAALLLVDSISLYKNGLLFLGPGAPFDVQPLNFLNMIVARLARSVGGEPKAWVLIIFALTLLSIGGLVFERFRTTAAFMSLLFLNVWLWTSREVFYGFHVYAFICIFLVFVARIVGDRNFLWNWGRILLCATYFNTGLSKLMSESWTSGEVLWLINLKFLNEWLGISSTESIAHFQYVFVALSLMIISIQLTSPIILWRTKLSRVYMYGAIAMHVGVGVFIELYLFSLLLIVMNLAFFSRAELKPSS